MSRLRADAALAWRLTRGAAGRAWLLVLCLAVGVAARAFVATVGESADAALAREARPLLGGDLEIAAQHPLDESQRGVLDAALPPGTRRTSMQSFTSMVRAGERTRLVEVRAVDNAWPLVGEVTLGAAMPGVSTLDQALAGRDGLPGAVAEPSLFQTLELRPGDRLRLGQTEVVLTAELAAEPGRNASLFSLGPRLLLPISTVPATGLSGVGARVRHATLVVLPDPRRTPMVADDLAKRWGLPDGETGFGGTGAGGVQVRTSANAQIGMNRVFDRLGDFLRLLALAALLLGGVGVASLVGGAVRARLDDLAVLQVLGASPGRTARVLLLQVLGLALVGALIGSVLGGAGAFIALTALAGQLPIAVPPVFAPVALLSGLGTGLLVALAFAAAPLLAVRRLMPLAVLRGEGGGPGGGGAALAVMAVAAVAVAGLAVVEARSVIVGLGFVGALAVGAAVLATLGWAVLLALSHIAPRAVGPRLGLGNLGRPGLRPVAALVAIGLSALLFAALATWQNSLEREFDPALRGDLPGLFVVDVQDDQVDAFRTVVRDATGREPLGLSPVVTARYRGKEGEAPPPPASTTATLTREQQRARFFRDREQRLSWRAEPGPDERTVHGRWPVDDPAHPDRVEASLDADFAERLGAKVGDRLVFDVQGTTITAEVVGLRDIRFTGLKPNFFILLNPAALSGAPTTWIAAVPSLPDTERAALVRTLVEKLPNLTVLDIATVAAQIRDMVGKLVAALRLVAWFALAAGVAVLIGVCLAGARERRADGALLRTLGAGDATLMTALATEFSLIGAVAAVIGAAVGVGTAAVLVGQMELGVHPPWPALAGLTAGVVALVTTTGLAANRSVLRAPPLAVLREG